jgi:hypothetical protein
LPPETGEEGFPYEKGNVDFHRRSAVALMPEPFVVRGRATTDGIHRHSLLVNQVQDSGEKLSKL